jgi:hypothetical protein
VACLRLVVPASCLAALALCLAPVSACAQWSVDVAVERFSWREDVSPIEVRELGPRVGLGVGFVQRRLRGVLFAYRGSLYGGGVHYDGSLQADPSQPAQGTSVYLGTVQAAELRHRWPDVVDAVAGLEADVWSRRLSDTQREDYWILSGRLGVHRPATPSSPIVAGGGVRWLLATREHTNIPEGGVVHHLTLAPGLGRNPYLYLGCRVAPRVTALTYWDGMRLGRSSDVVLAGGGPTQTIVFQPATDVDVLGVRVAYGF